MEHLIKEALLVGEAILATLAAPGTQSAITEQQNLSQLGSASVTAALIADPHQPLHSQPAPSSSSETKPQDPFEEDVELLSTTLSSLIARDLMPEIEAEVRKVFSVPGKLLAPPPTAEERAELNMPRGIWALICLHVARYCQPAAERDLLVRIALVCDTFIAALDCLDDVEDQDNTLLRRDVGDARTCNLSTILIALSHHWLLTYDGQGLPAPLVRSLLTILHQRLLNSAQGQHQDLLMEIQAVEMVALEASLSMTRSKSASLNSFMCQFPAIAVQAQHLVTDFAQFGELMGLALQINDDIYDFTAGLASPLSAMKSDVRRDKKTLPIVLAYQQFKRLQKEIAAGTDEQSVSLRQQAIDNAIRAAWGIAHYFQRQALLLAQQIETKQNVPFPALLRFLCGLV